MKPKPKEADGTLLHFQVQIPSQLAKKARVIAVMSDRTTSQVVCEALREYVEKHFPTMMK